ncbi:hypothetical protein AB4071_02970 [Stenotrophomonas sp. 2MCAF14_2]|uniref:hypothetical protein n=1 Tax=Stenotrophomonas sp. 2MCAF14_2 TaxID=3232983 RepID=UPI003F9AA580
MTTDKTPATLAVDVLAVLRSQLSWIGPCRPDGDEIDCERWDRIEAAIAAVAKLIEAADRLERKAIEQARVTSSVFNSDLASLRVGLARVKGESA